VDPKIGFCTNPDGARIAYATLGQGPAMVLPPSHWIAITPYKTAPQVRYFIDSLARYHTVVLYDQVGTGLSDRNRTVFTLESDLLDLETVIDHLKMDRMILFGTCFSGPISIAYAAKYPERVTHLILYGTYANHGKYLTDEYKAGVLSLMRQPDNWLSGRGARAFANLVAQGQTDYVELAVRMMSESVTPEIVANLFVMMFKTDVAQLCPLIKTPTLVMHRKGDAAMGFKEGLELASLIPNARFVPLEGDIHAYWLGDTEPVLHNVFEFVGDPITVSQAVESVQPAATDLTVVVDDPVAHEARSFIAALDWVALSRYRVVGDYTRYEETVRNTLKDIRHKIAAGFDRPSRKRENYLIWAAPGSGKTYFVQQVAASLPQAIRYQECNLAKCSRKEFLTGLARLDAENKPYLCLVDEVDAKPKEAWPYEVLLPYLDANIDRGAQFVFVLVGSSDSSLAKMKKQIASRPKGADLLTRIPAGNEYEIPSMSLGDRVLVVLSQFRQVGREVGRQVQSVEKLGLYYIALNSRLANARQLRELAVRTIERLPTGEDRVKYDHLFGPGDPENKAFWMQSLPAAADLANRFVTLED
jgi:pimeloyl-ACP methyl ester carboxylesterase